MEEKKKSGLATAGLVLGIIAIVGSWVPLLNVFSIILAILAIIFSAIPLFKKRSLGKAVAGLVLGVLTIIIASSMNNAVVKEIDNSLNSGGGTNKISTSDDKSSKTESTYSVGDLIVARDFEITVENVGIADEVGGKYLKTSPSEGGVYVTVDISYKNTSDKPQGMFSTPSLNIIDPNGVKYSSDISASSYYATEKEPDRKVLSDINPGIKVNDNKAFEISKEIYGDGEGWKILIKADKEFYVNIK